MNKPTKVFKEYFKKEKIFLLKNIKKNSKVLDMGSGTGRIAQYIYNRASEIHNVDFDERAIKKLTKTFKEKNKVKSYFCNMKKISINDNFFDYIICAGNTIGNMKDIDKVATIKEAKRVLKGGGKMFFSLYSEKALPFRIEQYEKIKVKINKIDKEGKIIVDNNTITEQFSKEKITDLFQRAGLISKVRSLNVAFYIVEAIKKS